eukprot:scaffold4528_cov162-Amphora_coffeaeformis.AAC.4
MGSGASKPSVDQTNARSSNDATAASSGCPVMHDKTTTASAATPEAAASSNPPSADESASKCPMHNADGSYSYDWRALFRSPHRPGGSKPLDEAQARAKITRRATLQDGAMASPGGGCPVTEYNVYSQPIDPKNNMPRVANQLPAAQQSKNLSTERVQSSIPKVSERTTERAVESRENKNKQKGGAEEGSTWTYPSPQMFYNSLARKNKLGDTKEDEIDSVVALHNNMNEKTWTRVQEWESVTADGQPKLLKFTGRPTDLSPKAMFKHYVLGHPLPYDRHDWTILRKDGTTVRYVIDYYYDETRAREDAASAKPDLKDTQATPSLLVDVRPALDGPNELWNRIITMPVAQVQHKTKYEYLPLAPTSEMKSQVKESVSVWASIQAAASDKAAEEDDSNDLRLTKQQAEALVQDFGKALKACPTQQKRLNACTTDDDCAKASVDYTLCLSKIICPIQHQAFTNSLQDESADADVKIESALEIVQNCVVQKTAQRNQARKHFGI